MDPGGVKQKKLELGRKIEKWCRDNHVTQERLAEELQVSPMTIRRLWHGMKVLSQEEMSYLSNLMKVRPEYFMVYEYYSPENEDIQDNRNHVHRGQSKSTENKVVLELSVNWSYEIGILASVTDPEIQDRFYGILRALREAVGTGKSENKEKVQKILC